MLFGIAFVETLFPPLPGDVLFVAVGGWGAMGGNPPSSMAAAGFLGCLLGSLLLHRAGRGFGRRALDGGLRWLGRPDDIRRAEALFERWGVAVLALSRFIPGVRSLLVLLAGSSRMTARRAMPPVALSAMVWYLLLSLLAGVFGDNWQLAEIFLSRYEHLVWMVLGALVCVYVVVVLLRRREGGRGSER